MASLWQTMKLWLVTIVSVLFLDNCLLKANQSSSTYECRTSLSAAETLKIHDFRKVSSGTEKFHACSVGCQINWLMSALELKPSSWYFLHTATRDFCNIVMGFLPVIRIGIKVKSEDIRLKITYYLNRLFYRITSLIDGDLMTRA